MGSGRTRGELAATVAVSSDLMHRIREVQQRADDESWTALVARAQANERGFEIREGLVCRSQGGCGEASIVIPEDTALCQELMRLHHEVPTGGHLGLYRMVGSLG